MAVARVDELDELREEYLALRERCAGAMLATIGERRLPVASYAPLLWHDGFAYLFLSDLAEHTRNLRRSGSLALLLVDSEDKGGNAFARRRISLQGEARIIARDDPRFAPVLAGFHRRFGQVMNLLEALPDFHLFVLHPQQGRYIRGFGQAYELSGEGLMRLTHVNPASGNERRA